MASTTPSLTGFFLLNGSGLVDLRLVRLDRDPVAAACSSMRRMGTTADLTARTFADALCVIRTRLSVMPHTTLCLRKAPGDPRHTAATLSWPLRGIVGRARLDVTGYGAPFVCVSEVSPGMPRACYGPRRTRLWCERLPDERSWGYDDDV